MALPASSCFDYVAEFTVTNSGSDEIVLSARSRVESQHQVLLGHHPRVRFWNDRVVIMAADPTLATMKWTSFPVGDVVFRVAMAGDLLQLIATATGHFGMSILRNDHLVIALGAVTTVNLGRTVEARNAVDGLHVGVGGRVVALGARESATEADGTGVSYDVYVERTFECGVPGVAECASIIRAGNTTASNAASRGAVLLATYRWDRLRGEFWDGRYLRA